MSPADQERDIQIARGVYAIGVAVAPPSLQPVMVTAIEEMQGDDWVPVPLGLARTLYDTLSIHIHKRMPYLGTYNLIEFDLLRGELRLSELGKVSLKKLENNVVKN